jgi:hypothetical protein
MPRNQPKMLLERVRLNREGYTSSGRYYGTGAPLYRATSSVTNESLEFRAADRTAAKSKLGRVLSHIGLGMDKDFNIYDVRRFKGE